LTVGNLDVDKYISAVPSLPTVLAKIAFVIMIIGAVIGYGQSMDDLKKPLKSSIKYFDPKGESSDKKNKTVTKSWNQVQKDVRQI
jgi:hypothetical protein